MTKQQQQHAVLVAWGQNGRTLFLDCPMQNIWWNIKLLWIYYIRVHVFDSNMGLALPLLPSSYQLKPKRKSEDFWASTIVHSQSGYQQVTKTVILLASSLRKPSFQASLQLQQFTLHKWSFCEREQHISGQCLHFMSPESTRKLEASWCFQGV